MKTNNTTVIFQTPGLIDDRAFRVMGMSAKTKENAIGYFGTGLKYAIAVLLRNGAQLSIYIGRRKYGFYLKEVDFRGKEFHQVFMQIEDWVPGFLKWARQGELELPFTTEYGRNWQPWQAFRELYANTLDEEGVTITTPTDDLDEFFSGDDHGPLRRNETLITVSNCPDFVDAYNNRGEIFLDPSRQDLRAENEAVTAYERHTYDGSYVYYQGMRAKDIDKPMLYVYNVKTAQRLTEDRTFAHDWDIERLISGMVVTSDDEDFIRSVVTCEKGFFEYDLDIPSWVTPSDAFKKVMMRRVPESSPAYSTYFSYHDEREPEERSYWEKATLPWKITDNSIIDADGHVLFDKPYIMGKPQWSDLAGTLVEIINNDGPK